MPAPWIFTFYSFKGGVGRSQAALNVAYTLAGWGRHVLLIDMDLEAPGLSGFLHRARELAPMETARHPDILTLLDEVVRASLSGDDPGVIAERIPPVSNYARAVKHEKLAPLTPKFGELGRVDVIGPDSDSTYSDRLAGLRLHELSHGELLQASRLLGRYLKAQRFPHRPLWRESFAPPLSTPYDYVIVDSRTGLTEIGGLCVGPLADRLVVLTGLNDQNVEGTLTFLNEVGINPEPRDPDGEPWDKGDPGGSDTKRAALGPKPTIIVASPVPAGEIQAKRQRLAEIKERLGIEPEQISYHPQVALMETLFVRDYKDEYLTVQYQRLADRVQSLVGDDESSLVTRVNEWLSRPAVERDGSEAVELAVRLASFGDSGASYLYVLANLVQNGQRAVAVPLYALLSQDASSRPVALNNWGTAVYDQAKTKQGEDADRLFADASEKYAEAVRLKPDLADALNNWGNALFAQTKTKQGEHADRLFADACEKYAEAVRLKPDYADALNNWGAALSDQAKTKQGEHADRLFADACEKYAEAVRLKPDLAEALNNWGNALYEQAKTKQGEDADRLFADACEKYAEAVRLKPDYAKALNNWGNALSDQAKTKQGEDADRLFADACEKYGEAVRLRPDYPEASNNWGIALYDQAKTKQGEDADRLFTSACEKYAEAVRLKPDYPEALNNWGAALSEQAKTKQDEDADRLFADACEKYGEAVRLKPDYAAALYNWGAALSDQAKTKQGEDADRLFADACEKYGEAVRLKPDDAAALYNWGAALSDQAKAKQGEDVDRRFADPYEKYVEAVRLKPDLAEALNNWGAALLDHAKRKRSESTSTAETDRLLRSARIKLEMARELGESAAIYNLACLEAIRGDAVASVTNLNSAAQAGYPLTKAKIAAETDFDAIRQVPEFLRFVAGLPEN